MRERRWIERERRLMISNVKIEERIEDKGAREKSK